MWELSLNLQDKELADYLFSCLNKKISALGGVITRSSDEHYYSVLIGVKTLQQEKVEVYLKGVITEIICTFFKSRFLDKNLFVPYQEKMGVIAFKKALLNFDRETDRYLIQKYLTLSGNFYLESFYQFKLKPLKDKWTELVTLANENRDYLISTDAFFDLLKFLIDNLDICEEEVDVFEEADGYKIYFENSNSEMYQDKLLSGEGLVASIIDLSPQKINLYCHKQNSATNFLEKIYEKRVQVKSLKTFIKR